LPAKRALSSATSSSVILLHSDWGGGTERSKAGQAVS
jgi:hypothetical protein